MSALDAAIAVLESEVAALMAVNRPSAAGADVNTGSADWFLLRAKSLSLSSLRRMAQLGLHEDAAAAERYHRAAESHHVRLEVPAPVEIDVTPLPAGTLHLTAPAAVATAVVPTP